MDNARRMPIGDQVLERLVEKLGGPAQAAVRLGITPTLMQHLLKGSMPVPDSLLLKAVDLVLDELPPTASLSPPKRPKAT
jgi:hypothetical protein